jgi:hypothetical protein
MNSLRHAVLLAGLALAARLPAAEPAHVGTDSPFLPAAADGGPGKPADAPLELRGVLNMGGEMRFNIVDASTKKGTWVELNQPGDFRVVSYEKSGDTDTVTVEQGGRSLRLELLRPKTGKAAPAKAPGAATAVAQQGPVTPVVLNPTPADQARALEDTIAEVRRRRLLRQQPQQPGAVPGQPQPANPQAGRPPSPPSGTP